MAASASTGSVQMEVPAFTNSGIECLKQVITDNRAAGSAPPKVQMTK